MTLPKQSQAVDRNAVRKDIRDDAGVPPSCSIDPQSACGCPTACVGVCDFDGDCQGICT